MSLGESLTHDSPSDRWGASELIFATMQSMKSQPPLRLATFCVEASHALQGVVVDAVALNRVQLMPMPLQIIPSTGFPAERFDSYLAGCYSGSSEPPGC